MDRRTSFAVVTLLTLLAPRPAWPQALTGTLISTVQDSQRGRLAGALIRISSESLIGGTLTTAASEKGQIQLQALPPGLYVLEIKAPGFSPYREDGISTGAGATVERTVVLSLQGISEVVALALAGLQN